MNCKQMLVEDDEFIEFENESETEGDQFSLAKNISLHDQAMSGFKAFAWNKESSWNDLLYKLNQSIVIIDILLQ